MANDYTPQQIEEILQMFFDVAGTRQYIGARYVPIFGRGRGTSVDWDNSDAYEPLSIVYYQGDTYTSRRYVPAGIPIDDQDYWVITGRYNAQVEQYRQEVLSFQGQIDDANEAIGTLRDDVADEYVPFPDSQVFPKYGTLGQVLTTLSNGETKWEDPVVPSDAQAETVITRWLDDHPEATTTVPDGAISTAKLANGAVTAQKLSSDLGGDITMLKDDMYGNKVKYSRSISGTIANRDFPIQGVAGTSYYVRVSNVSNASYTAMNLYFIRADNSFRTIQAGAQENVTYIGKDVQNFVSIRVSLTFSTAISETLTADVVFGVANESVIGRLTADEAEIAMLDTRVDTAENAVSSIDTAIYASESTFSKTFSGLTSYQDFAFSGEAGKEYYLLLKNVSRNDTAEIDFYFMRANNTFQTISTDVKVGQLYLVKASLDFVSVRLRIVFSESVTGLVTADFSYGLADEPIMGRIAKLDADVVDLSGQIEDVSDATINYISGICAPCAVGDSLTAGLAYSSVEGLSNLVNTRWSWATQLFKKENGTDVDIVAQSSATPRTLLTDKATEISQINNCDCVCIYMGTNQDMSGGEPYPIGTAADVVASWDDTPTDTFIGWYSKLVRTIMHYNSEYAFYVCFGLIKASFATRTAAIRTVCETIGGNVIFQDILKYSDRLTRLTDNDDGTHYTPIGYAGYKEVFKAALNEAIFTHPTIVNKTANVFRGL